MQFASYLLLLIMIKIKPCHVLYLVASDGCCVIVLLLAPHPSCYLYCHLKPTTVNIHTHIQWQIVWWSHTTWHHLQIVPFQCHQSYTWG